MPTGVDIVVPVHGAAPDFERCVASVRTHSALGEHRLIVVLDGPQPEAIEKVIAPLAGLPSDVALVVRQPARRGFAAAVNRGIASSERDVVLLNSDTQVTAGWLDKLQAAAGSAPQVGTVTPFTSHGTICSLPRFLAENTVPAGHTVDSFAALVERVSQRSYPRLPTGIGFCLYVRRALLDRVGLLDEARFGLGYGEENDLCRRATAAGFVHLLDDATYVWHRGRASFGAAHAALVRRADARMRRLHPDYPEAVANFIRTDPIRPARDRVLRALAPARGPAPSQGPRRVLHLVHGWPPFESGASETQAQALARRQAESQDVSAYARAAWPGRENGDVLEHYDRGVRVRLFVDDRNGNGAAARDASDGRELRRDFATFLRAEKPQLVHVHDLGGDGASLVRVAAREGVPIVYQFQDVSPAYPGVNLLHPDGSLCSGPALRRCGVCAPLANTPAGTPWNRLWSSLRRNGTREKSGRNGGNGRASFGAEPNPENMDRYAAEIEAAYAEVLAARRNGP